MELKSVLEVFKEKFLVKFEKRYRFFHVEKKKKNLPFVSCEKNILAQGKNITPSAKKLNAMPQSLYINTLTLVFYSLVH